MPELSAVILTLNEQEHIEACLQSLAWADRRLVFDSFSQDGTVARARAMGAEIVQHTFENYAQQRNAALAAIDTDWVFFVDADERGTPELGAEVRATIEERPEAGWYVPRHNYIFGRLTLGAGWFPDYQLRLFRHGSVRYERPVHEIAQVDGEIGRLSSPLVHLNYRDLAHFHHKQSAYTDHEVAQLLADGVRPRPHAWLLQPWRQFWWRFVTLGGYRDGWHGLRLSVLMAYYEAVKYRRAARLWRQRRLSGSVSPGQSEGS